MSLVINEEFRAFLHKEAALAGCTWSTVNVSVLSDKVELIIKFIDKQEQVMYGVLQFDGEDIAAMYPPSNTSARRQLVRKELADLIRPWRGTKSSIKALQENPPEWGEYGY